MVQPIGCTRTKQPACDLREIPIEFHEMNDPIMVFNQKGTPTWNVQLHRIQKEFQIMSTLPIGPTGSIQPLVAAQSCPTRSVVASPLCHGQCSCGEPTPLWPTHPMLSKPHHPIGQPTLSWPICFLAANARQSNRRQANPSPGHASRAKPG